MIAIREARESDAGYVMATALRQVPRFVREVRRGVVEDAIRAVVYSARVVVACAEEDDDALCGWAAGLHSTPLFVFVPRELRGAGIGKRLIEAIHADVQIEGRGFRTRTDDVGVQGAARGDIPRAVGSARP